MARLAAIAKSLYYPTQDRILTLLLQNINIQTEGKGWILDPCCGKGLAVETLAKSWGLLSIGVEIDYLRYEEAKDRLDVCHLGSIHQIKSKGNASVVFLNPPYDQGEEGRQEAEFLRVSERFMGVGSLLIYVVPIKVLDNSDIRSFLREKFAQIKIWKYPNPEFSQFKQIVILAQKKKTSYHPYSYGYGSYYSIPTSDGNLPILGEEEPFLFAKKNLDETFKISMRSLNPVAIAPGENEGVYNTASWDLLVGKRNSYLSNPLMPPRNGHRAMMLVSGYLNGLEVTHKKEGFLFPERKLIKGRSVKSIKEIEQDDKVIEREQIDSIISELDLDAFQYSSWNAKEDKDRTIEWFDKYGTSLSKAIKTAYTPQWDGELDRYDFSRFKAPGVLPGRTEPEFLEVQKQTAAAIGYRSKTFKTVILCGEQGVGKTSIASMATGLSSLRRKKTVIICPSHLVGKWKRETSRVYSCGEVSRIAEKISEVDDFFSHQRQLERFLLGETEPKFLIISKERAKLGAKWEKSAIEKTKRYKLGDQEKSYTFVLCPDCGHRLKNDLDYFEEKKKVSCEKCGAPLWQYTAISAKGTKRWPLAHWISKHHADQYNLILDETHAFAKAETDQGKAVQMLCSGANKIIPMTGTLYGGRASSLFHLLYKVDPIFREMYDFSEAKKFSQQHGLFETVFKEEEHTSRYGYRRGRSGGRIKEIPGVSPTMINLLLHFTIFVKLRDLGIELPEYSESVSLVDPDPEVAKNLNNLEHTIRPLLRKNPSLIGAFLMSSLGYADAPEKGDEIWLRKEDDFDELIASLPSLEKEFLPKDEKLLEIVLENKKEDRQVMVFFTQTQKRNPIPRVRRYLESKGLRVVHMPSSVSPKKREAWVKKALEEGFDVFLTNGRLVETGLDLLFAKTIVQYGIEYSINSLRQSIRRSWRLGQDKDIKVVFLAYRNTLQADAMQLIAKKMKAAELLDGEDEFSGLSQHDDSAQDFLLELAQKVMRG